MAAYASRISLRRISAFSPFHSSLKEPFRPSTHEGKAGTSDIWKKIFCFVCLPSLGLGIVNVLLEEEHERPEFRPYPHLRLRTKPFPWGDGNKTLFHNPKYNALPDGYET